MAGHPWRTPEQHKPFLASATITHEDTRNIYINTENGRGPKRTSILLPLFYWSSLVQLLTLMDWLFVSLSFCLSVCLSVSLYLCISRSLYLSVSVSLSLCLSVCLCLSICQSVCLSICLSVCLSLSVCLGLSVCLSTSSSSFSSWNYFLSVVPAFSQSSLTLC